MRIDLRYLLPVGVLVLGAIAAVTIVKSAPAPAGEPSSEPAPLVVVEAAKRVDLRHRVRTHGTVTPRSESDLTAEISGRVIWISSALASGGFFTKDDPLLRIDPHDYGVALERARAALVRSESLVVLTRKELARQERLAGQSVASEANLDAALNADHAAEAGLREARALLSQAERDLERTEIRAPYDGRIREESVDVGQWVNRGNPIAQIYAVDYAEVRLPVPDDQLAFLDVPLTPPIAGADEVSLPEVVLFADFAGAPRTWRGRVVRTEGEIDPRTRMIHVVARVADPYRRESRGAGPDAVPLANGLFVEAEIVGREARGVIVVPRSAIRDGDRVFVVSDDGELQFRDVGIVRRQRDSVVVTSGLEAGDRIVTSPITAPVDGMRVRVQGEDPDS